MEYRRRGVVPGGAARGGIRGGLATARWGWQRLDEVSGSSAVIDRLEMDSVYVLRARGCNKAGYGEYSEEVYLHTPPAPGTRPPPDNSMSSITRPKHNMRARLRGVSSFRNVHEPRELLKEPSLSPTRRLSDGHN